MIDITVQRAIKNISAPTTTQLRLWAKEALHEKMLSCELTIRIVDENEITALNSTYRHKNGPTNVLSFPFDMPEEMAAEPTVLGDIVICAAVVNREADEQHKSAESHWAHMVVHGVLHLLGYDHEIENEAVLMEAQEIQILQGLGYKNPYLTNEKRTQHE